MKGKEIMTKHTPGPWEPIEWDIWEAGEETGLIARCADTDDGAVYANARLIAAAPDLFSALRGLNDTWGKVHDYLSELSESGSLRRIDGDKIANMLEDSVAAWEGSRAAIAKVKGA